MKNNSKSQSGLIPPALGILFAASLLHVDTVSASENSSTSAGVNAGSNVAISRSLLTRTSVLWSNPQWQEFKRIWKKLHNIAPADGDYSSSLLDHEHINKIRVELDNSYAELMMISEEIGIDSLEIRLLHSLASDRLMLLSYGSVMSLTRMMPPPVADQTDDLVPQIEARIGTVARLREDGLISSEEMITAFRNLKSSIDSYFLLETIRGETNYSGVLWSTRWPLEVDSIQSYLDSIKTTLLQSLSDSGTPNSEGYRLVLEDLENMERSISDVKDMLPGLHDLLLDLELF